MRKHILSADGLTIKARQKGSRTYSPIIENAQFHIDQSEIVLLQGNNGTGKTSILKAILNDGVGSATFLDWVFGIRRYIHLSGVIKFKNREIYSMNRLEWDVFRQKNLSYLEQHDEAFITNKTGIQHVIGDYIDIHESISEKKKQEISTLFDAFDVEGQPSLRSKKIFEMSGGDRRTVSIISALSKDADLYIFDEPLNNLDHGRSKVLSELLTGIRNQGRSVFVITHCMMHMNPDRIYVIENRGITNIEDLDAFYSNCPTCASTRERRDRIIPQIEQDRTDLSEQEQDQSRDESTHP
jgi:ABC-type multidrug transport system ATPase subunit